MDKLFGTWKESGMPIDYLCGYCNIHVLSQQTQVCRFRGEETAYIAICTNCNKPTFFYRNLYNQYPGSIPSNLMISFSLPEEIKLIYEEMITSYINNSFTSVLLLGRKGLMHLGCLEGAEENKKFVYYVNYFKDKQIIPATAYILAEKIRDYGNDVNHNINLATQEEALDILKFTNLILQNLYHFRDLK